jgi:oxygen-independent coproporphyrinogen-3 oxidase
VDNYSAARHEGFDNINIDLMFSIPGQTLSILKETLENAASLEPEHISCYSLIVEEGTEFWRRREAGVLRELDEETDRAMYYLVSEKLEKAGYARYEISNYAKTGFKCVHNIIYWKTGHYLGIGAGAHSYLEETRFSNERDPQEYISKLQGSILPVDWQEKLGRLDMIEEFMFMGLRMAEGVSLLDFKQRFGIELMSFYGDEVNDLVSSGLLVMRDGNLILTGRGVDLSNRVFVQFIK